MKTTPDFVTSLVRRLLTWDGGGPLLPAGVRVLIDVPTVGAWQVRGGPEPSVEEADPGPHDCVVRCPLSDLRAMASGTLDPRRAFLAGRLELEGDVGLALRLQQALQASAA